MSQVGRMGTIASTAFLLSVAAGCTHQSANVSAPSSEALGNAVAPQAIQQPFTSTALKPVPVPNLIPATAVPERLPEVTTDRPDPFATLLMVPTSITRTAAQSAPIAPPVISLPAPIAPTVATISVPRTLPAFQPPTSGLSIPTNVTPASVIPAVPPISAAQAIEVSGVVQAGSSTSIIIKAPDERTSRYISVGDRLANGRVLVKRVEMGAEPVVILEQDGAEVIKTIGSRG